MCERKSTVYHFENHIVTRRNYRYAYSLAALGKELIFKRIKMQCNFWTDRSSGPMWACDFPVTALISSQAVHLRQWRKWAASLAPCVGSGVPQASPLLVPGAYLHAVPLHRPSQGVHSLPANEDTQVNQQHAPDNHKQFLVLDDLQRRQEQKRVDVREIPQTEAEQPGRGSDCHSCSRVS